MGPKEAITVLQADGFSPATKAQVSHFLKRNPLMRNHLFIVVTKPKKPRDKDMDDWREFGAHWPTVLNDHWRLDYYNEGWYTSKECWCYLGVTAG
jgi:hypothetical protein